MSKLLFLAGPKAYAQIRFQGLSASDINMVIGASGAAKWLSIYGLDRAIFSDFLPQAQQRILLYGTSVGAFKLAAASQADPAKALQNLACAYIDQYYEGTATPAEVKRETQSILDELFADTAVSEILQNPHYSFHLGAVRCKGILASKNTRVQKLAMIAAFLLATVARSQLNRLLDRTVMGNAQTLESFTGVDAFNTERIILTEDNLITATLASGSIPVIMQAVSNITGTNPRHVFRDGGLIDYHPVPANLVNDNTGLVLYPHFYPYVVEGWFDKFFPWRKVSGSRLDNVILIAPSAEFVRSLPHSRIPSRQDFHRYKNRNQQRQAIWSEVMQRSLELGDEFLAAVKSGEIAERVQRL